MDSVNIFCENLLMRIKRPKASAPRTYHHGDLRRSLIDSALALVTEEQDWAFSLREVARRAGVSHNAPYNHFADKRDLLAAVATAGFSSLGERMLTATSGIERADSALVTSGVVYVTFGVENPAHYRLMFSSALINAEEGRPESVVAAGLAAREILAGIIRRGAMTSIFDASLKQDEELHAAVLAAWSIVHGLTMLTIDGVGGPRQLTIDRIAKKVASALCYGLVRR